MNMWLILMIVLAVLSFAGILYLANRIGKFAFIRKITKGKKGFSTLTGLLIAVVYTAVIWMAWGSMNAIVCILHLIVFWMVSEAIFALITKIRKKTFAKGGSFFRFTYRNWTELFQQKKSVYIRDIEHLPEQLQGVYMELKKESIRSIFALPVFNDTSFIGIITI